MYVYMMTNKNRTVLYVGVTNDIARRLHERRSGKGSGFTARYNLCHLVFVEGHDSVDEAIAREKQIKGWSRRRKNDLVQSVNPNWRDLSDSLTEDPLQMVAMLALHG
jgi:predicted GIY-YIG superfamily endonuclease